MSTNQPQPQPNAVFASILVDQDSIFISFHVSYFSDPCLCLLHLQQVFTTRLRFGLHIYSTCFDTELKIILLLPYMASLHPTTRSGMARPLSPQITQQTQHQQHFSKQENIALITALPGTFAPLFLLAASSLFLFPGCAHRHRWNHSPASCAK